MGAAETEDTARHNHNSRKIEQMLFLNKYKTILLSET
jgi:hypothetical protein